MPTSDAELGPFEQRFHVAAADVSGEQPTCLTVTVMFVNAMAEADPVYGIVAIGIDPIGVKTGQQLVDGDTGHERVELDDRRPILRDPPDVTLVQLGAVCRRVGSVDASGADLLQGVDVSAR